MLANEVADGVTEIESANIEGVGVTCVRGAPEVNEVIVVKDPRARVDVVRGALLATTVRAVLVGITASFCPRQTLYADAALWSTVEQAE